MEKFKGIFPALLTPFDANGKVSQSSLEKLVEYNLHKGVAGFYVCGSTAEAFMLSAAERKYILELVISTVAGRAPVIAHVGGIGTLDCIEFAMHAEKSGADMISAVAPFYYGFSFNEIRDHYRAIADSTGLPMLVYNFPAFSGVTLTVENAAELLGDPRFIGIKHTSNNFYMLERLKNNHPDKLVYNGYDEMFLAGISMGADGGIGSTYNFMAEKFIAVTSLFKQGKYAEAQQKQSEINIIIDALIKTGVFQGEKAILDMLGIQMGDCRPPFKKISTEDRIYLEKTVLPLL